MSVMASKIGYVRLRAPQEHGKALQSPALSEAPAVWIENSRRLEHGSLSPWGEDLRELRSLAQREVVEAATQYTRQYRNVNLDDREWDQVVVAGHQPQLFHPGVWYKNFVLDQLGQRLSAIPINLLIDNDICSSASIRVPTSSVPAGNYRPRP